MHTKEFLLNKNASQRGMNNKAFSSIAIILAVVLMLTAVSCGGAGTTTGAFPVANTGGPYFGNVNQALAFDGSGSSAPSGRSLVSFSWNFGDGGSGTGAKVSHTYTVAGNYTATLTVTDSLGATGSSSVAVQIITAPVAKPGGPYSGKVGVAISFNGSASTAPPGQSLGFSWNFGDGATATGATPTHTYGSVGTFNVTLTVTDDTAGVSIGTTTATIVAGPAPGGPSANPSTSFAIGPAANASTQFAYVLTTSSSGASSLTIETIDTASGELRPTDVTPPSLDSNFIPSGMISDPSRKFLYLYGGNSVLTFSIALDTGALIPSGTTATNSGTDITSNPVLLFNPNGKSAFFITQHPNDSDTTAPGSVTRFSVDPNTGMLGVIETVSAQVLRPQAATIDPSGEFLYVSGAAPVASSEASSVTPQIAIFAVAPGTGALTPISESPLSIESGVSATSMAIDSTGRFMYVAGRNSTTDSAALSVFTINTATGALAQTFAPTKLGDPSMGESAVAATSLALSPSGGFGYVFTILTRDEFPVREAIQLFELDNQTGAPTSVASIVTSNTGADPVAIPAASLTLFSPNQVSASAFTAKTNHAGFLFLTGSSDATVLVFSTDTKTGFLNFPAAATTVAR
jgi:PKD repeat protein